MRKKEKTIYIFRKYSEKSKENFKREKSRIKKNLPKYVLIEHVGSTAVIGLGGKNIIDLLIGVPKGKVGLNIKRISNLGYDLRKSPTPSKRLFFRRQLKDKRFHIHLVIINSKNWEEVICFRNLLISDTNLRKDYSKVKRNAFLECRGDGEKCRKIKSKFIETILKEYSK